MGSEEQWKNPKRNSPFKPHNVFNICAFVVLKTEKEAPYLLCNNTVTAITGEKRDGFAGYSQKSLLAVYHMGEPFQNPR